MANESDLRAVFRDAEQELLAKARASGIRHRGSSGTAREAVVADFLRRHLPRSLAVVHSAEIVNPRRRSGQVDVVIHKAEVPPLVDYGTHHVVAGESVVGAVEVKSRLDRTTLEGAYGQLYEAKRASENPKTSTTAAWIVALSAGRLAPLRDRLEELHGGHGDRQWLDGVWVPGQGGIVWAASQRPLCRPEGGATLRVMRSADTLFLMLWLMTERLREHALAATDLLPYANQDGEPLWEWAE